MPYTYLIGWKSLDRWYYGVRWSSSCHPGDLWVKYFTSSDKVAEMRSLHGEPDVVEVRKVFNEGVKAREWEERVLRRLKVISSDRWLNLSYGGSKFISTIAWNKGIPLSEEQKEHLRKINTGKRLSDETKAKIVLKTKGLKRSEEVRSRLASIQLSKKGIPRSDEVRQRMKEAWEKRRLNHPPRPHTSETKAKMSESAKRRHSAKQLESMNTIDHN